MRLPDYSRSILSIPAGVLAHYGAANGHARLPELDGALKAGRSKVLMVILDGLGSAVLRRALPENAYLRRKTVATFSSVFPPTTAAAATTLYSGLSPAEHGWLGWHLYFQECAADVAAFLSTDYYTGKRVPGSPPAPTLLAYETLFEKIRRAQPSVALHALCGCPAYFTRGADVVHRVSNFDQLCARLRRVCDAPGEAFALAYWTQPDAAMHAHGVDSEAARAQYACLNAALERLSAQIRDALLIVVSDHGLTDAPACVDIARHPDVMDMLVRPPSMDQRASAFFIRPDRRADFAAWFDRNLSEDFVWISREDALRTGLFGPGARHPKLEDFLGDGVAAAVGRRAIACNLPASAAHSAMIGRHAGLTDDEMLVDVILDDIE